MDLAVICSWPPVCQPKLPGLLWPLPRGVPTCSMQNNRLSIQLHEGVGPHNIMTRLKEIKRDVFET